MIDYVKTQLCEKWGKWEQEDTYEFIGSPEYLKAGVHFSYIFTPTETEQIERYACECKVKLSEEIYELLDSYLNVDTEETTEENA